MSHPKVCGDELAKANLLRETENGMPSVLTQEV
jgi:hypothetical protein